jgi:hypothetical protein
MLDAAGFNRLSPKRLKWRSQKQLFATSVIPAEFYPTLQFIFSQQNDQCKLAPKRKRFRRNQGRRQFLRDALNQHNWP